MKKLRSQWLKTKGTPLRWSLAVLPISFSLVLTSYFRLSGRVLTSLELNNLFINLLSMCALFFSAIFVYLIVDIEKSNQHFFQEKRPDISRLSVFISKVVFICLVIGSLYVLGIISFVVFWQLITNEWLDWLLLFKMSLLSYWFLLPLVGLYTTLSYHFSINTTMIFAAFSMLSGILLGTTGLGSIIWQYIPFTWTIRIPSDFLLSDTTSLLSFMNNHIGLFIGSLLLVAILFILQLIWYNQGDEKKFLGE